MEDCVLLPPLESMEASAALEAGEEDWVDAEEAGERKEDGGQLAMKSSLEKKYNSFVSSSFSSFLDWTVPDWASYMPPFSPFCHSLRHTRHRPSMLF